jgi:hypothetical protein
MAFMTTERSVRARAVPVMAAGGLVGGLLGLALAVSLMGPPTGVLSTTGCGPTTLVQGAGFDPWTGQPRGQVIEGRCMDHNYVTAQPVPTDLVGRVGFPWASAVTVALALAGAAFGWVLRRPQPQPSKRLT